MEPGLPSKIDLEGRPHSLYEGIEYREFWDGLQRHKLDELERAIVRNLLPFSGHRIIDVGCGYGRLADCYLESFQQVIMVDGSMSLLHQAIEQTKGQAIYIACDVANLPFRPASFDTVLLIRVFHHISDSRTFLKELHRILCNDGTFIFSYRNKRNALRTIQWFLKRNTENPFTIDPGGIGSPLIRHHPKAVHRMLLELGFAGMRYYGAGVFDWLAGKLGSLGKQIPTGRLLAGVLGRSKIAPWIICGSMASGNTSLIETDKISDLLQCPSCGGNVSGDEQEYICNKCKRRYPVEDGIIDLRV